MNEPKKTRDHEEEGLLTETVKHTLATIIYVAGAVIIGLASRLFEPEHMPLVVEVCLATFEWSFVVVAVTSGIRALTSLIVALKGLGKQLGISEIVHAIRKVRPVRLLVQSFGIALVLGTVVLATVVVAQLVASSDWAGITAVAILAIVVMLFVIRLLIHLGSNFAAPVSVMFDSPRSLWFFALVPLATIGLAVGSVGKLLGLNFFELIASMPH